MKKIVFSLFLFLFINSHLFAQDTLSIYFDFGNSKIVDSAKIQIDSFFENYDDQRIDSILFIGITDSIGDNIKNYKLSEKRAKNVLEYSIPKFSNVGLYKSIALGEETKSITISQNRRVDIIVYKKPIKINPKLQCYIIDYDLLHRINIKYPIQNKNQSKKPAKKKGNIYIRVDKTDIDTSKHYYYSKTNKTGDCEVIQLNWRAKTIGFSWSEKSRYVAKMPYASYDATKFFTITEMPCISCQDTLYSKVDTLSEIPCLQTDRFIMKNIQFRKLLFNPNYVKARVPKDFINYNDTYYSSCNNYSPIRWSKRFNKYSYTRLPIDDIYVRNITRNMTCCSSYQEPSECNTPVLTLSRIIYPKGNSYIHAQIEEEYSSKFITNIGGSISYDSFKFHGLYFLGANTNKQLNSSLRFQYSFFAYPRGYLMECVTWGLFNVPKNVNQFSKFYIGCDLHGFLGTNNSNFSQNINLGYAFVNFSDDAFITRMFIQYEYWPLNNRLENNNGIRIGILTKIYKFK